MPFQKGNKLWDNPKSRNTLKNYIKKYGPWNKGTKGLVKHSDEWRKMMSKKMKGRKFSEERNKKISKALMGNKNGVGYKGPNKGRYRENSFSWKGGKFNSQGYWFIYKPEHLKATKQGYVKQSTLMAERYLRRLLNKDELIHHINGIKNDDRIENFYLFSCNSEHRKYEGLKNKPQLISNLFQKGKAKETHQKVFNT